MMKMILTFCLFILVLNFSISQSITNNQHLKNSLTSQKTSDFYDTKLPDCTNQLIFECAIHIQKTIVTCSAAFESGGSSILADIKCAKNLLSDRKTCWSCICSQAQKRQWKIIGC